MNLSASTAPIFCVGGPLPDFVRVEAYQAADSVEWHFTVAGPFVNCVWFDTEKSCDFVDIY